LHGSGWRDLAGWQALDACRPGSFLPVRVLSRVFRRLFLKGLTAAYDTGELQFFSDVAALNDAKKFAAVLAAVSTTEWDVYAKEASANPNQVLCYLSRYTHRVAITNNRLVDLDKTHVSFRWKDYRESSKSKVVRLEIADSSLRAVCQWASR
jgi:hypothetical protein